MSDKADVWMPLWIGAYLADTTALTTQQHGAYLLLLMAYWRERAPLQDDDEDLRSIVKADRAEWKKLRPKVAKFFKVADGVWWHKRVEAEIAEAEKRKAGAVAKAQAGGQAAAEKRRKQAEADASSSAPGSAPSTLQAVPAGVLEQFPTPSPISLPSEEKTSHLSVARTRQVEAPDCPHLEVLALWNEVLPALPQHIPSQWKGARADHLRARWRETAVEKGWTSKDDGLTFFRKFFGYVGKSQFLTGRARPRGDGSRPFIAELEWLVNPTNWAKTLEGKYHQEAA